MALNRGIPFDSTTTEIRLNNRLFETPQGSLLFTFFAERPNGVTGEKLLLGNSSQGYIYVNIDHKANNKFDIKVYNRPGANDPVKVAAVSDLNYGSEITLGVLYDAANGTLVARTSQPSQGFAGDASSNGWTPPGTPIPTNARLTADAPASIGLESFKGFIGKLATYDGVIPNGPTNSPFNTYIADPLSWPTGRASGEIPGRVHLLDASNLVARPSVNTNVPETQKLVFGAAASTGYLSIGGVQVLVNAGDSGATVADKVKLALEADAAYKTTAVKQKITFGANTTGTAITVDGVAVTVVANDGDSVVAGKVAAALIAAYAALPDIAANDAKKARIVEVDGNAVIVTFADTEANPALIRVDSKTTGIAASVDQIQNFSSNPGRTVTKDGANGLLITFSPADPNPTNLSTAAANTKFLINSGSTGVTVNNVDSAGVTIATGTASGQLDNVGTPLFAQPVPSEFSFVAKPQGKVQKILITKGAATSNDVSVVTVTNENTNVINVAVPTDAGTTSAAVAQKIFAALDAKVKDKVVGGVVQNTTSKIAAVSIGADGESVLVRFVDDAATKNAPVLTISSLGAAKAIVIDESFYGANTRAEQQKIFFTAATGNGLTIDGVLPTTANNDSAAVVAQKVKAALEARYGAETQTLTFTGNATAPGILTIEGVQVGVLNSATNTTVAQDIAAAFNQPGVLAASRFAAVTADGAGVVTFRFKSTLYNPGDVEVQATGVTWATLPTVNTTSLWSQEYSKAAIFSVTLKTATTYTGGNFTVGGIQATAADNDSAAALALKLAAQFNGTAFNAATAVVPGSQNVANYSAVIADGDTLHFIFKNSAGNPADLAIPELTTTVTGVSADKARPTQAYDAGGVRRITDNNDGSLTIDFHPSEGNVAPLIFNANTSGVQASVSTTREHHLVDVTSGGYSGAAQTGQAVPSKVIYAQLTETDSPQALNKSLKFDLYIDPAKAALIGGGYESISFTMRYPTADFDFGGSSFPNPRITLPETTAAGTAVININKAVGEITMRWVSSQSVTDLTKPIASIELNQKGASNFRPNIELGFSNVEIDGVNFTNRTTFTETFSSILNTERHDVSSKVVNGLDATIGIGGQLVAYWGGPAGAGHSLSLAPASFSDFAAGAAPTPPAGGAAASGTGPTLNPGKTAVMNLVTNTAATKAVKFTLELPSNVATASFALSAAATAAGLTLVGTPQLQGRSLTVEIGGSATAAGLPVGGILGAVTANITQAMDKTHEFAFTGVSMNGATSVGKAAYVGFTTSYQPINNTPAELAKAGNWTAKDMPRGDFNKQVFGTAPTKAASLITSADALEILKLSAGFKPGWVAAGAATPDGAYIAADVDGNGIVSAQDALIALRYSAQLLTGPDPMVWRFFDSSTQNLNTLNSTGRPLKQEFQVTPPQAAGDVALNTDWQVKAVLVGNLTTPSNTEYLPG